MKVGLAQTDAEKLACFPVMKELRTHLEAAEFMPQLERQEAQGYRLAFVEESGQVVAVARFWMNEAFAYGKYMYVYDLVASERARSGGHGRALLEFLNMLAKDVWCAQLHLD